MTDVPIVESFVDVTDGEGGEMMDVESLLKSKSVEVSIADIKVDSEFVKNFRRKYSLTQIALANILGVSKKAIEKWEQGANRVSRSNATLLKILDSNPELIGQLYSVSVKEW